MKEIKSKISIVYKKWFWRDLDDLESMVKASEIINNVQAKLIHHPNFSTDKLNYLASQGEMYLSLPTLSKEMFQAESRYGSKYTESKEAVELQSAMNFCLVQKFNFGRELLVHLSDSPDIILLDPLSLTWVKRDLRALFVEVMQIKNIPVLEEKEKSKWVVQNIIAIKFNQRYAGKPCLLVNIRENDLGKNELKRISKLFNQLENVLFQKIIITNSLDPILVCEVFPNYSKHYLHLSKNIA
jgi:hypothetical protein